MVPLIFITQKMGIYIYFIGEFSGKIKMGFLFDNFYRVVYVKIDYIGFLGYYFIIR